MALWHWFWKGSDREPCQNQCHSVIDFAPIGEALPRIAGKRDSAASEVGVGAMGAGELWIFWTLWSIGAGPMDRAAARWSGVERARTSWSEVEEGRASWGDLERARAAESEVERARAG